MPRAPWDKPPKKIDSRFVSCEEYYERIRLKKKVKNILRSTGMIYNDDEILAAIGRVCNRPGHPKQREKFIEAVIAELITSNNY